MALCLSQALSAEDLKALPATLLTQKKARSLIFSIPAPRGQIVDRNGEPLAQNRVGFYLAVEFPPGEPMSREALTQYVFDKASAAGALLGQRMAYSPENLSRHYQNRPFVPFVISTELSGGNVARFKSSGIPGLRLCPVYLRYYPLGATGCHLVGYASRDGAFLTGPHENGEPLFPPSVGREGLEQTFEDVLKGKDGKMLVLYNNDGVKVSEVIDIPPVPGHHVVTTIDLKMQRLCEETLAAHAKRGALVFLDPKNGDILAMASHPGYDPNFFVPSISPERFKALQIDPDIPLLPRAFRSSYPPGSVFKVFVGLGALQDSVITANDEFGCPASLAVGNLTFRNWKKDDAGSLNFVGALAQSCNTWFYQVGLKMGPGSIVSWANQFGFGKKTGIPMNSETDGRVPSDFYMEKTYGRKLLSGDTANLSIGQGDLLISPLQMAAGMGGIANGGALQQSRLVQAIQNVDLQVVTAYPPKTLHDLWISEETRKTVKKAMVSVVSSGTGGNAAVDGIKVAGKTGTAQWGPKAKERTAAWFAGFAPADEPQYAFAAVFEGESNNDDVHGGTQAAPMIGKVLREMFKGVKKDARKKKDPMDESPEVPAIPVAIPVTKPAPIPKAIPVPD